ncbi:MAG: hypothetical protein U1E47_03955 [Rivihabitans pingtungensis]
MTRSVTGAAWIINVFKGLHQADSGGAHVGLGQSLIVNNKFAAGANIHLWRLSAMHSECGEALGLKVISIVLVAYQEKYFHFPCILAGSVSRLNDKTTSRSINS